MGTNLIPSRLYAKGSEPKPEKSINHHSRMEILPSLQKALQSDEWVHLRNSSLGVFIKFFEMKFQWSSRIVHYMLSLQLECKQKNEIWCLIGSQPVRFSLLEFQHLTGLNCEYAEGIDNPEIPVSKEIEKFWKKKLKVAVNVGPSVDDLIAACKKCGSWTPEERIKLGYLSLLASFIEAHDRRTPIRVGLARLVMDIVAFENYPWGRVAFKKLITSVKDVDLTKNSYTLEGFGQLLQIWVYYALPDFGLTHGSPVTSSQSLPMLSFKGMKRRKNIKSSILKQRKIENFVVKAPEFMFPYWDDDVEDPKIRNLVNVALVSGAESFTSADWSDEGVEVYDVPVAVKKKRKLEFCEGSQDMSPPDNKGLTLAALKEHMDLCFSRMEENFVMVNSKLEDVVTLSKRVEAMEAIVVELKEGHKKRDANIDIQADNYGDDSELPLDEKQLTACDSVNQSKLDGEVGYEKTSKKRREEDSVVFLRTTVNRGDLEQEKLKQESRKNAALLNIRAKSERLKRLAATQRSPYTGSKTVKSIVGKTVIGCGYDPFLKVDSNKVKALNDWLKLNEPFHAACNETSSRWFYTLRTPQRWLMDTNAFVSCLMQHIDAGINLLRLRYSCHKSWFRNDKICFLDSLFTTVWSSQYPKFLDKKVSLLPPDAFDYHAGEKPLYCKSRQTWGLEVEDIYCPLHIKGDHWIALWISIPNRHIVIWDSDISHVSDDEVTRSIQPFIHMLPHLLNQLAPIEEKFKYSTDKYTFERPKDIPWNEQSGDCGVYALKFIECHALGMSSFPTSLCDANIKAIRAKLAAEMFHEFGICASEGLQRSYNMLDAYE